MRNRIRFYKPNKPTVTSEEWEAIEEKSKAARSLLNDKRFSFFRELIDNHQKHILEVFAKQSIEDVYMENRTIAERNGIPIVTHLRRLFRPAKKEYSHLSGEYKFAEHLMDQIKTASTLDKEVEKKAEEKIIQIDRGVEE